MAGVSSSSLLRLRRSPVPVMLDGLLQANAIDNRLAIIEDDGVLIELIETALSDDELFGEPKANSLIYSEEAVPLSAQVVIRS